MFEVLRARLLEIMRVPAEPAPPAGAPGSVRVFRAGRNLYKLRVLRWALAQVGAVIGIVFSLTFLTGLQRGFEKLRFIERPAATATAAKSPASPSTPPPAAAPEIPSRPKAKSSAAENTRAHGAMTRIAERAPSWIIIVLRFFEWVGIALFVAQIPLTYALVRLDYELRWYIVTDRSLRIRSGLTTVRESTMSFANVQQVVVTQGPVQRLLGVADVRVQSAGGGGTEATAKTGESLHTGVFQGVDNAHEIRDLIQERLRLFRHAGLGDPDERAARDGANLAALNAPRTASQALAAARELLGEARALRATITSQPGSR